MTFLPVVERELRVGPPARHLLEPLHGGDHRRGPGRLYPADGHRFKRGHRLRFVRRRRHGRLSLRSLRRDAGHLRLPERGETRRDSWIAVPDGFEGRDVVLGKLAATSLNVFYGMLAVLPMLAIPFVLGGVTHAEMLRVVLVSINLLLFFLGIGLFVSSFCRQDNRALGLSSLIALALVVCGPLASQIPRFHSPRRRCSPVPPAPVFWPLMRCTTQRG